MSSLVSTILYCKKEGVEWNIYYILGNITIKDHAWDYERSFLLVFFFNFIFNSVINFMSLLGCWTCSFHWMAFSCCNLITYKDLIIIIMMMMIIIIINPYISKNYVVLSWLALWMKPNFMILVFSCFKHSEKARSSVQQPQEFFIHWINETDTLGLYLPRDTPRYRPHALDHNGLALWMVIMDI